TRRKSRRALQPEPPTRSRTSSLNIAPLFVSKGFDGVQASCAIGWVESEEQADADRDAECEQHRRNRDHRRWKCRARDRGDVRRLDGKRGAEGEANPAAGPP